MGTDVTSLQDGATVRASDAEREATAALLGRHYVAGRLAVDEYSERVGRAYAARTRGELQDLLADLPAEPVGSGRRRGPAVPLPLLVVVLVGILVAASAAVHAPLVLVAVPLMIAIRRARGGRRPGAARPA